MSARVVPLEKWPEGVREELDALAAEVEAGRIRALVLVTATADGGLTPCWGASRSLGPHGGTILRGMVAFIGAVIDALARADAE